MCSPGRGWVRRVVGSLRMGAMGLSLPLLLSACGGEGSAEGSLRPPPAAIDPAAPGPVVPGPADVAVLMIGNSHTVGAGLPVRLQATLQAALPGRQVQVVVAPSSAFLDEHLRDASTLALLSARRWQAVVLQAQKYSSSGTVNHPTDAAEALIRRVRSLGAVPVLYPEWARRGVAESDRIWALHRGIAQRAPACVAPVPQAWDAAQAAGVSAPLHAPDGNHADAAGAQLTAWVLTGTITTRRPDAQGDVPGGGPSALQAQLRVAAATALRVQDGRAFCPDDPVVQ